MTGLRTAAQQALEALEQDNPAGRGATITALRAALEAQQEAEPVAEVGDLVLPVRERLMAAGYLNRTHLYTTPPTKKPLPPGQIRTIALNTGLRVGNASIEFVRAIEAALKDKNHA